MPIVYKGEDDCPGIRKGWISASLFFFSLLLLLPVNCEQLFNNEMLCLLVTDVLSGIFVLVEHNSSLAIY